MEYEDSQKDTKLLWYGLQRPRSDPLDTFLTTRGSNNNDGISKFTGCEGSNPTNAFFVAVLDGYEVDASVVAIKCVDVSFLCFVLYDLRYELATASVN